MALNTEVKARELAVNTSKLRSDCDTVAIELDRVLNLAKEMYNGVNNLNGMWKGTANQEFVKNFSSNYETMKNYVESLKKLVDEIVQKCSDYERCECEVSVLSENKINSSFGEITLQVSPAQLNSMASDISKKADTVNSSFSDIYSKVDGMLIYWRGVVADEKVSALKKQKESTDNMIKNLKTYVEKLRQITENYETAENTSVAEAGELPSNILE